MKILCINGSPKKSGSTSEYLLKELEKYFVSKVEVIHFNVKDIVHADQIKDYNSIVIAFPLYVDGVPSHILRFMKKIEEGIKGYSIDTKIYIIINCGFIEAHQNRYGVEIIKNWCKRSKIIFGGGIAYGGGGMSQVSPMGKGPSKSIGISLDKLSQDIECSKKSEVVYIKPNFPRFLYIKMAHMGWKKQGKENGLGKKDLYRKNNLNNSIESKL